MRVLVISGAFPPMKAGEAEHALLLCRHLADRGLDVHALTSRDARTDGAPSITLHPVMRDWSWSDASRLRACARDISPDAVLLFYIGWIYNDHPMMTFAPALCRSVLPRARFVTMFTFPHGWRPDRCSLRARLIRKAVQRWAGRENTDYLFGTLLRGSDSIIVLSDRHRKMFSEHFPAIASKSVLVPPPPLLRMSTDHDAASRQHTRSRLGVETDHFLVAHFGFIYPPKGMETLIQAIRIASSARKTLRLIVIGGEIAHQYPDRPSYVQQMRDMTEQMGIADRVIWIGEYASDSDEASRYLWAADACAFANNDGVYLNNSSLAAAAAHGLPIIGTQGTMTDDPFVHGENILFCPPRSPERMAELIQAVMDDPALRMRLHNGSRALAAEWFTWDKAIDRMLRTFGDGARPMSLCHRAT